MRVLKKIMVIILSLISFCSLCLLMTSILLKWNLKEQNINHYIKENELSFILKTRDGKENIFIRETRSFLEDIGFPKDTMEEIINSEASKDFIGKYIYNVIHSLLYDKEKVSITKEDLTELAKENFKVIDTILQKENKTLTKRQKEKILKLVEEHSEHLFDFFPTAGKIIKKLDQKNVYLLSNITLKDVTNIAYQLTQKETIMILGIIFIISNALLITLLYQEKKYWDVWKSTLFCYAFFLIFIEIMLGTVIKEYCFSEWESANVFINYLINVLSKNLWAFVILSFVLILIINWKIKKKEIL